MQAKSIKGKSTEEIKGGLEQGINCAGRFVAPGPLIGAKTEGMRKVWNVTMAAIFTNAEAAGANGGNLEMHNDTTCCIALKER